MFGVATIQEGTMLEDTGFHSPILMPGWAFPGKCEAPYHRNLFPTILSHKQTEGLHVAGPLFNKARPFISRLMPEEDVREGAMPCEAFCCSGRFGKKIYVSGDN